jgi:prepilin-type N-terminal cleavage/methylation domain-containing protein
MNSANSNPSHRNAPWRTLPVEWLERADALPLDFLLALNRPRKCTNRKSNAARRLDASAFSLQPSAFSLSKRPRAFTILELMIVIGIIGLMAGLALPHLRGFTSGSAMTAATRQLVDDVALARQRAMANRSQVCMVFAGPNFWVNDSITLFSNAQVTTLVGHQYSAYAIISLRTVGDQPGKSNVHYLTDWKYLPQGVFISPFQFTNTPGYSTLVSTTNTTAGLSNGWQVAAFLTNIAFPFPSTFDASSFSSIINSNYLPYIGFTPGGQLTTNADQFIMLTSGSIFTPLNASGLPQWSVHVPNAPVPVETPPNNEFSNPNLIHIDWLTGRARIERNQF